MEVQFQNEILFETVELEVARDVVEYSFIVQKSLTYLDLSAYEYTKQWKSISTEEQCRKLMEPRRKILYTLNLDLAKNLESSLRATVPNEDYDPFLAFHLGAMIVCDSLYNRGFTICVINAILFAENKIEKLRKYLNVIKLLNLNQCKSESMIFFNHLILVLYPYCLDSNLIVEFALTFRFCTWVVYTECPIIVCFVLRHAFQVRCNILEPFQSGIDTINGCILFHATGNIIPLLEFGSVLGSQHEAYLQFLGRPLERRMRRRVERKNIPDRRLFLMLQFIFYFQFNNPHWDSLIYIWRSIPDPYLSESEIRNLLENSISPRILLKVVEYYKFYIAEESEELKEAPRTLQQLCRVATRSAMIRNHQLPYGIRELGKPGLIEDYLNLKC